MTLYEIEQALIDCIDDETGEVLDFTRLDELQMAREAKIENIALYIKNLLVDAYAIRDEEKALAERRRAKEKRAESLKEYLNRALDGNIFETAKVRVSFRSSTKAEITDILSVIDHLEKNNIEEGIMYLPPKVSIAHLKELLKSGAEIPGAELRQNINLQIK